jgi:ABC-type branched-subunit amino acid transport system ATPase component
LIGPNGAGKTTLFNACTGNVVASAGSVRLGEHGLSGKTPAERARCGLGRTFQRIELFDSMTVLENISMGVEARLSGGRPWHQVVATRAERRSVAERAEEAIERCGITVLAGRMAGSLPTGQRRLVELARALACAFDFLLLDEPSSGLDVDETEHFRAVLEDAQRREGIGVLLVEHDMALIRAACTYTYVLDFGKLIGQGPMAEVLESEVVQQAYLGTEEVA